MGGATGTLTGTYLMFFLTTFGGLTPAEVGIILAFAKFADMAVVLVAGGISDNLFKTKIGRKLGRRHLPMLVAACLILVAFSALFMEVPGNFWYYLLAYFFVDMASTINGVAYETLATEMTTDYQSRVKLTSTRMFVSAFSTFAITGLPAVLLGFLGDDTPIAYTISGVVFGVFLFACLLVTYFTTWERSPEQVALDPEQIAKANEDAANNAAGTKRSGFETVKQTIFDYGRILKTKAVRNIVIVYFMSYFAKDCFGTTFLYFAVVVLGLDQKTGQSVLSLSFLGMIVVVGAGILMSKFGPKLLWTISYSLLLFTFIMFGVLHIFGFKWDGQVLSYVVVFGLGIFYQIGRQLLEFTPWQVIPFVPDVDRLVSTKSRVGTFASLQTFLRKTTGAFGMMLVGAMLSASGYVSGQFEQNFEVEVAISIVFILIPALLIGGCFLIISRFNLNEKTHKVIIDEIERLENGGSKADATEETKKIVEDLSGYKYENVWNPAN
jgi:oligogalacturonide transporter